MVVADLNKGDYFTIDDPDTPTNTVFRFDRVDGNVCVCFIGDRAISLGPSAPVRLTKIKQVGG